MDTPSTVFDDGTHATPQTLVSETFKGDNLELKRTRSDTDITQKSHSPSQSPPEKSTLRSCVLVLTVTVAMIVNVSSAFCLTVVLILFSKCNSPLTTDRERDGIIHITSSNPKRDASTGGRFAVDNFSISSQFCESPFLQFYLSRHIISIQMSVFRS